MENKVRLITPFLMLFAGALASVIMYIKKYDLYTMLWVLLVVLIVFYIIGDVVRYLYAAIRPRIIPDVNLDEIAEQPTGNVVEKDIGADGEEANSDTEEDIPAEDEAFEEEYSDEVLEEDTADTETEDNQTYDE